jgi:hypothetical protein
MRCYPVRNRARACAPSGPWGGLFLTGCYNLHMLARYILALLLTSALLSPSVAAAFPFGGQAFIVRPCYNNAIYIGLGPPRGGPFVWTPGTRTYMSRRHSLLLHRFDPAGHRLVGHVHQHDGLE